MTHPMCCCFLPYQPQTAKSLFSPDDSRTRGRWDRLAWRVNAQTTRNPHDNFHIDTRRAACGSSRDNPVYIAFDSPDRARYRRRLRRRLRVIHRPLASAPATALAGLRADSAAVLSRRRRSLVNLSRTRVQWFDADAPPAGLAVGGIGDRQRNVIAVQVARDHVGSILQGCDDPPAHWFPDHHLVQIWWQAIALVVWCQVGVDGDLVFPDLDQTLQTRYCERFRSSELDMLLYPSAAPSLFPPDARSGAPYRGCSGFSRRSPNTSLMISTRDSSSIGLSRKTSTGR
jgi:hypothetical protein